MTGVGLDLLEIDRLAQALARRPRLAERLFTDAERAFAAERGEPARHLAVRFCAKEAVAKALALRDGDWHDVEVLGGGDGPPRARLSGRAAARAAELGVEVEISLTHSKGMAGAVAVLK
jgi:holo-[acyl-carrier protein] synthase